MSQMAIGIPSTMGIRWSLLHCNSRLIGPKTHWRVCNRMLFCHTRTTYIQGCKCLNKTIGKLEQNQSNWFPEMFKVGFLDAHCIFKNIIQHEPTRFFLLCFHYLIKAGNLWSILPKYFVASIQRCHPTVFSWVWNDKKCQNTWQSRILILIESPIYV